jgi:hypothetical protein
MQTFSLEQLSVNHPYYCHGNNYYSNDAAQEWDTWKSFHEEYADSDMNMNLAFRWDVIKIMEEDCEEIGNTTGYCMKIFMMGQRKGIFIPHFICNVSEEDVSEIISFLQPRLDLLKKMWLPFI